MYVTCIKNITTVKKNVNEILVAKKIQLQVPWKCNAEKMIVGTEGVKKLVKGYEIS